ncbi:uncharacterized protein [Rutidosis leptorrhynchoides]|uniref:uncharacterized protein n=1 Tax=Rutidosis leptorrhynchoides TaxID=125765 RepID=UPI003A9A653A
MRLTHVCFADDLLVFLHGDVNSVKVIKQALEDFSSVSGLFPNMNKTNVFFGSLKRLGIADYKEIIDKIRKKIDNWKNKHLSYAGRLQLIASVAWEVVYNPKNQGGLGLKSLKEWNDVLLIKQLWKLIEKKDSLWFNWVNLVKLKGKSIWKIECKQSDNWGRKYQLKMRDRIKDHVREDNDGMVNWVTNSGKIVPYNTSQV